MRITGATVALLMVLSSSVSAVTLKEAWRVEGLSSPESAVFDPAENVLYVSNVAGKPAEKDGKGFVSRVSPDGKVLALEWATGLDAPKGMALVGDRLYVADIDRLIAIDTKTGKAAGTWAAPGSKFLNDVAADERGRIFVSDMALNQIWLLDGGQFTVWLEDAKLENPNGLKVAGNKLMVASWGVMAPDFSTKVPGHLKSVDLASKEIKSLGDAAPVGNLDGLEPDGAGGWFLSDWLTGGLFHAGADGKAVKILPLPKGSADIGIVPAPRLVIVPMMLEGALVAYRAE